MINNNESKVILWNGKAQYLNINGKKRGIIGNKNGREVTNDEVFKFAEDAWEALREEHFLVMVLVELIVFCRLQRKLL